MSRLVSRIQTRRQSRIGLRLASIPIAFTRSTPAYLDGVEYPAGVARYPSQSGIRGVLVEEGTTPIQTFTNDLTNAVYTKSNLTTSLVTVDGEQATRLIENTTPGVGHTLSATAPTAGQPTTVSCEVKMNGRRWVAISPSGGAVYYDLQAGALGTQSSATGTITALADGWYRLTVTVASASGSVPVLYLASANGVTSYTGDGASGVYVRKWQTEHKAYATSYMPRPDATAVTRNAETLTVSTVGLLTPSAGSVIIKARYDGDNIKATPAAGHTLFTLGTANAANTVGLLRNSAGNLFAQTVSAGGAASNAQAAFAPAAGDYFAGMKWGAAELAAWQTGVRHATVATPNLPTTLATNCNIGSQPNGSAAWNHGIYGVWFYDRTLSDAEMAAATLGNLPPDFTAHLRFTNGQAEAIQGQPWGIPQYVALLDAAHAT